jgi:thymidylate synthase
MINIIVCTDINGGISKNGQIPWKIQEDYNFFRDTITNKQNNKPNVIIMGRNTYKDMNLVKGHINVIISNTLNITDLNTSEKVFIFNTIKDALQKITEFEYGEIFVCGGKKIYEYFLENIENGNNNVSLYWTLINENYDCDNRLNFDELSNLNIQCRNINNNYELEDILNKKIVRVFFQRPTFSISNREEEEYIIMMNSILSSGKYAPCRNGYTYSNFGNILRFNLNSFPLLTTKKMFMKCIFEELMYFIKGDTNSKHLFDKGVKIWEKNTSTEFIKKCNLQYEEFDMGPMYGFQWRHFNAPYEGMNASYDGKGFDQLQYILSQLKNDPNSRRILMTTYNPAQAKEGVLFPCHGISIQFNTELINDNRYKLNISQNQRSCDYFLGVPFNIASYALLNYMVCHVLNNDSECKYKYEPGELVMFLGDYHIYKEHKIQAIRQILRIPKKFPKLEFKRNIFKIEDFNLEDIDLINYDSYSAIQADMIA